MGNDDTIHIKQPKTYKEQIELFKKRGLVIEDEASAISILSKINYYRFSAYTLTLKKDNVFHESASFNQMSQFHNTKI